MTWSVWDVTIVVLFALQAAVLVAVAVAIIRIKTGVATPAIARVKSLAGAGATVAQSAQNAFAGNRNRVTGLIAGISGLRDSLRADAGRAAFAGEPVTYARLASAFATVRTVRNGWKTLGRLQSRAARSVQAAAESESPRRSIADRLGLIPPAARHIAPVMRYARIALNVWKQVRKQGLL